MSLPIVLPGQVYLHEELDQYLVVTRATRGEIVYRGLASGRREISEFLRAFPPVDPADLTTAERDHLADLAELSPSDLKVGWTGVFSEDDEDA